MQFTTIAFAVFLTAVFLVYWSVPTKYRNGLLLLVSYGFYMTFSIPYVTLLIILSLMTYVTAIHVQKKAVFVFSILTQVLILMFFKYAGFLPSLKESLVIPVGISFYTFKAISYLCDVHRKKYDAYKKPLDVLLFLAFFPDIVSGPINRADGLIPQFHTKRTFDETMAGYGLRMILWGLFKKLVIADTLARYVNLVFETPGSYMGLCYIVAGVFYTIQIYCDFSGYSDMAIGIGRLFGIVSMDNFKSPYFSTSIKEFWGRWHISLSSFLKEYVYIPLGGSRKGKIRTYVNLMVTFLVSGIWHGANVTFIVWGAFHGFFQIMQRVFQKYIKVRLPKWISVPVTVICVGCAWVFFRANSVSDAVFMFRHMFYNLSPRLAYEKMNMNKVDVSLILCSVSVLTVFDYISLKQDLFFEMNKWKMPVRYAIYVGLASVILAFHIHGGASQQFIYFSF